MPSLIITRGLGSDGGQFLVNRGFGGTIAGAPYIYEAVAIDGRHLRVIFSERVQTSYALNAANYTITGASDLIVYSVTMETESVFILTTSLQAPGQLYQVTAANILDLDSVPI